MTYDNKSQGAFLKHREPKDLSLSPRGGILSRSAAGGRTNIIVTIMALQLRQQM